MSNYDSLKLENQLCFPLYACSKAIVHRSNAFLRHINLSYTQYIVMMVLWEQRQISLKDLGKILFLDSGTLTPVLKNLEAKGYLTRQRDKKDERILLLSLTAQGRKLREKALAIPENMRQCISLGDDEMETLYRLLYKIIDHLEPQDSPDK